jgi:hypothetical protein
MLCDFYVLKPLRFGTHTLCAATFCNITSCDVYFMLFTLCSNIKKIVVLSMPTYWDENPLVSPCLLRGKRKTADTHRSSSVISLMVLSSALFPPETRHGSTRAPARLDSWDFSEDMCLSKMLTVLELTRNSPLSSLWKKPFADSIKVQIREKRRGKRWVSLGNCISLVLLGGGGGGNITQVWEKIEWNGVGKLGACTPHPQQAGPKIQSSLNVHKKVAISSLLYSPVCDTDHVSSSPYLYCS